jgi:hypothetical protein
MIPGDGRDRSKAPNRPDARSGVRQDRGRGSPPQSSLFQSLAIVAIVCVAICELPLMCSS